MASLKVAVIGAGMAGLVAARELKREAHHVTVFERYHKLGGTWIYDARMDSDPLGLDPGRQVVHTSMYKSLRVNLPRQIMAFINYPFVSREGGDPRSYPGHEEVLRYLEDFAQDFDLNQLIRFEHDVIRVEQVNQWKNKWVVEWRNRGGELDFELFEAVVVCNGKHTEPKIAHFPGRDSWPGLQLHSHNYRTPEPFHDKTVVLIGKGPSARDILSDISYVAKEVHQAIRGSNVQSRKLENHSNIWQHPMIEQSHHEDGKIVFMDGSFVYADAIIHCTGYKYHFPFLRTHGVVNVEENCVGPLYQHVFPPSLAPYLSFVGLPNNAVPGIVMELQSTWIARVLSGKVTLPTASEMSLLVEEFYRHMHETGWPKHLTHKLQQNKFDYENWLIHQIGIPPLEDWKELLFHVESKNNIGSLYGENYRDTFGVEKWLEEAKKKQNDSTRNIMNKAN